jgi:glutathione peroxidase
MSKTITLSVEPLPIPGAPGARGALRARALATVLLAMLASGVRAGDFFDEHAVAAAATPLVPAHWVQAATAPEPTADCPPLLRHTFNQLQTGEPQSLCRYQGKVLLIVNTASYCGYTRQYEALEAIYRKYKDRGLVVVGFPSNDFSQEPGNSKEIAEFCRTTYGVQFPLYEKTTVAHLARNPFYGELAKATGQAPQWNFHKYVVDRTGKPVASFASATVPDAREITSLIEKLLEQKQKPPPVRG